MVHDENDQLLKGIVDRIEGDVVLIETDAGMHQAFLNLMPSPLKEGDCVAMISGVWHLQKQETEKRRAEMDALMESLLNQS